MKDLYDLIEVAAVNAHNENAAIEAAEEQRGREEQRQRGRRRAS